MKKTIIFVLAAAVFAVSMGGPGTDPRSFAVARYLVTDPVAKNIMADPIASQVISLRTMLDDPSKKPLADKYNLCDIHVPGTNLFCGVNKQIPRYAMPQLSGKPLPGTLADKLPKVKGEVDASQAFVDYLIGKSPIKNLQNKAYIISCPEAIPAGELKATQSDLVGSKVAGMWWALSQNPKWQTEQAQQCGPAAVSLCARQKTANVIPPMDITSTKGITAPIFVSQDNYILDGHHRWATIVAASRFAPQLLKMCARKVNAPIEVLLREANNFTQKFGLPAEAGTVAQAQPSPAK